MATGRADYVLGYQVIIPQRQTDPPPPEKAPCVSADHGLQPLRVTSVRRAPPSDIDHARHAVAWLEGRASCSKSRIHHEMRRAPEAQTALAAFFASSSAAGTLTHR